MPNSTPPEHAAAAEDATGGGTSYDEAAGMLCHYSTNAKRAPPRLELKVDAPLLRLIKFMRSAAAGTQVAVCRAEDEELGEPAKKRMGRRRLGKVAVRLLQLGPHNIVRTDEVEIFAKFLYKKPKKIVCQIRAIRHVRDVFIKINILCSNIKTMEACFNDARFDTLRIQVKSSSEQYRADPPPPGMHLPWRRIADVTEKTFFLQFEKGTLERSYGKMLYTHPSLILLPLPRASNEGDEQEAQATTAQQTHMIRAAVPVPPSVEAVMTSTRMIGSTYTGANFAAHEHQGYLRFD
ncbi:uncharacterized protein [Lolium perenne]|uniref:uncharacterized protein n=1 Tax=Lolium perenne TaxID=4522 RepID=UPI003A9905CC